MLNFCFLKLTAHLFLFFIFLFKHSVVSKLHSSSKKMKFTASQQILFAVAVTIFAAQVQSVSFQRFRREVEEVRKISLRLRNLFQFSRGLVAWHVKIQFIPIWVEGLHCVECLCDHRLTFLYFCGHSLPI